MEEVKTSPTAKQYNGHGAWDSVCACVCGRVCVYVLVQIEYKYKWASYKIKD